MASYKYKYYAPVKFVSGKNSGLIITNGDVVDLDDDYVSGPIFNPEEWELLQVAQTAKKQDKKDETQKEKGDS